VLRKALEQSRLERRVADLEEDLRRLEPWELVGDAPPVHAMRDLVDVVADDGYTSVLILGETGTGKELVARAIHSRGRRKSGPFVAVSIASLSRDLVESELFGHVRGAFTGATDARAGYIERADGGVLFLDEIGELSADVQVKLLRVLEQREVTRVGTTAGKAVDIQLVCATHRDLAKAVESGAFRQDLYFRLRTVEITVPPLRDRATDVPLLIDHFLFLFRQQGRTRLAGVTPEALARLSAYAFPGNVRELRSIVERAMMVAASRRHSMIDVDDLPGEVQHPGSPAAEHAPPTPLVRLRQGGIDLDRELARAELELVVEALHVTSGKKTEAWRLLGLNDRYALRRRIVRIRDAYPDLVAAFPLISQLYSAATDHSLDAPEGGHAARNSR
jgi:DNA-binding NtrC family response regulator